MTDYFAKNFKEIRNDHNLTQQAVADALSLSKPTIVRYENPKNGTLPRQQETIDAICDLFNVTEQDLFGFNDGYYSKKYNLTNAPKGALAVRPSKESFVPVRVLGKVHAGEFDEQIELDEYVECPASIYASHPDGFALKINGRCVEKEAADGEYGFFDPTMTPHNGSFVVVEVDGFPEAILRQWFKANKKLILAAYSYDESYEDYIFDFDDTSVKVLGVMYWHQANRELS